MEFRLLLWVYSNLVVAVGIMIDPVEREINAALQSEYQKLKKRYGLSEAVDENSQQFRMIAPLLISLAQFATTEDVRATADQTSKDTRTLLFVTKVLAGLTAALLFATAVRLVWLGV